MNVDWRRNITSYGLLAGLALLLLFLFLRHVYIAHHPLTDARTHQSAPTGITRTPQPHRHHAVISDSLQSIDSMRLQRFGLHHYLVNFAGLATYHGSPCPQASILIRIATDGDSQTVGLITNADGTYATQILVEAMPNDPIDWVVEGYTPEFKKVEIVGRRIGTNDEDTIGVEQEVAFLKT